MKVQDDAQHAFLVPQEIARLLRLRTPRPVYNAIASGELVAYQFGRDYRVRPADFEAYVESKRKRPHLSASPAPAVSLRDLIDA